MREFPKHLNNVAIYLRKSRADLEAELRGEGETLSKHKKALLELAHKNHYNVLKIYEEVVSGERIADRPEVIHLLNEVEEGTYEAVLVMDIDRLGRGDMRDQGTIIAAFKESKTFIITPQKCYDLEDEFDEEYSEFEAFMARRELKMITKRMQRGRVASVKEGKFLGSTPPYGYDIGENLILVPNEKAEIVKMMFRWYAYENMGTNIISNRLNEMGILSPGGKKWSPYSVNSLLKNAVYIGRMQWKKSYRNKKKGVGYIRPQEEWLDFEGKHEPLIDKKTFDLAQEHFKQKTKVPNRGDLTITNPLAGIIRCGKCDRAMVKRPYTKQVAHLMCSNTNCDTKSTRLEHVENRVIGELRKWLATYKIEGDIEQPPTTNVPVSVIKELTGRIEQLEKQKNNLHDLLEQGVYDTETYLERNKSIMERISETKETLASLEQQIESDRQREQSLYTIVPRIEYVLDVYDNATIETKNELLKQIIAHATYTKEKHRKGDDFDLILYIFEPI